MTLTLSIRSASAVVEGLCTLPLTWSVLSGLLELTQLSVCFR